MPEKISPDSTMFFNSEIPKHSNRVIDEVKAIREKSKSEFIDKYFYYRKRDNNVIREITE